jgi:hypothetical protein
MTPRVRRSSFFLLSLMGAAQQMAGKGGLTAVGLKQVAAASSGKVQPAVPMTKTRSMQ